MKNEIFKRPNCSIMTLNNFYSLIKTDLVSNYCPTYFDSLNVDVTFVINSLTSAPIIPTLYIKREGQITHITSTTSKESFEVLHKMMTVARFMDNGDGLNALYELLKPRVAGDLKKLFDNSDKETIFNHLINFDILPIVIVVI